MSRSGMQGLCTYWDSSLIYVELIHHFDILQVSIARISIHYYNQIQIDQFKKKLVG